MSAAGPIVFITGARGFIGRHSARHLAAQGWRVAGIGHGAWPAGASRAWGVSEWRNGEVSHANLDALAASVGLPEAIVHLAGGSSVGPSFAQPAEDFHRSVVTASELAEWVRLRAPQAPLVMASSAAVYGNGHDGPIAETTVRHPYSPYGYHKRMAELVLESYAHNFGLRVAVVRFFSVYGPGLAKQLLWDACTRLALAPASLTLGGTGRELRDWLHVDDAAALLAAAIGAAATSPFVVNGGTGIATPVRSIAACLCAGMGMDDLPLAFSGQARAGDPASLVADISAARAIGWQPERGWQDGVADYVSWFRSQRADES